MRANRQCYVPQIDTIHLYSLIHTELRRHYATKGSVSMTFEKGLQLGPSAELDTPGLAL